MKDDSTGSGEGGMREFPAVIRNNTRPGKKAEGACNSELIDANQAHQRIVIYTDSVHSE
jgi:hypothetical protein